MWEPWEAMNRDPGNGHEEGIAGNKESMTSLGSHTAPQIFPDGFLYVLLDRYFENVVVNR